MRRQTVLALAAALLVALAGCAGTAPQGTAPDAGDGTATDGDATDGTATTASGSATNAAVVNFYVSDEANAIGDFRHVNVTVTKVGFERAGGGWTEFPVDDQTVDLTDLQGKNATLVDSYDVPNGTYTKVFLHVGEVNATLANGEQVRVKLPSERLHVNEEFAVENGSQVDFVFDITVHEAGKSGKYILKPVVSESGTDVEIEATGGDDQPDEREGDGDDGEDAAPNATFVGDVTPGENATVAVTRNGSAVANATVVANGQAVGATGTDGRLTFAVPDDAEELTVEVEHGGVTAELEVEFETDEAEGDGEDRDDAGSATPTGTEG